MAVKGYEYFPDDARNIATGKIETDLAVMGVPLNRDTVLKHLRQAAELLPDEIRREILRAD